MKKKKLLAGVMALATVATAGVGLVGCKNGEPGKNYYLTFDEDNNPATHNETKTVLKTDINNFEAFPELEADPVTGFAGEWKYKSWNGDSITLIASYGDGTEQKPYLVKTAEQFKLVLDNYCSQVSTKFYASTGDVATGTEAEEANALVKVEVFKTFAITYIRTATSEAWPTQGENVILDVTNKLHIRLIGDVDLTTLSSYKCGDYVSISLDAGKYDLKGNLIDRYEIKASGIMSSSLFNYAEDSIIKNLNFNLSEEAAKLIFATRFGELKFENVTVNSANNFVNVHANNGNYSPFISHILRKSNTVFKNCTNNVNFMCSSKNMGIFVGGYGTANATITFDTCVNNGDVKCATAAGMFIGNRTYNPTINIVNCKNTGDFTSKLASHVLAGHIPVGSAANIQMLPELIDDYDVSIDGVIENTGEFSLLTSNYSASVSGADVTITNGGEALQAGKYEFNIMSYFKNSAGSTLYVTITKEVEVLGTEESVTFEDVNYLYTDKDTHVSRGNEIPANVEWINVPRTSLKYFIDETSGYYVFDLGNEGLKENIIGSTSYTTNDLKRTVIVRDSQGNIIDFVVDVQ